MKSITNIFKFTVIVYCNQNLLKKMHKKHKKNARFSSFFSIFSMFLFNKENLIIFPSVIIIINRYMNPLIIIFINQLSKLW